MYFRIAAKRTLPRVALLLAIPFVGLLIAAGVLHDMRFLFIAIMVPLIFAPMVMAHIFYSTLLHPDARRALRLQKIAFAPDAPLHLSFLKEDDKESDASESAEPTYTVTDTLIVPRTRISSVSLSTDCLIFHLTDSCLPIAIPLSAFPPSFNPFDFVSY